VPGRVTLCAVGGHDGDGIKSCGGQGVAGVLGDGWVDLDADDVVCAESVGQQGG
jgi:hypothetical protein